MATANLYCRRPPCPTAHPGSGVWHQHSKNQYRTRRSGSSRARVSTRYRIAGWYHCRWYPPHQLAAPYAMSVPEIADHVPRLIALHAMSVPDIT
eukprot:1558664-Rhodomonas_salina.3